MSSFSRLFDLAKNALNSDAVREVRRSVGGQGAASARDPLTPPPVPGRDATAASSADRQAIARYDYLMQTADPQHIEQIHRDAFARLTPDQRGVIERRMRTELPVREQPRSSSPGDLARAAGRAEAQRPGRMRGILARAGGGAAAVGAGGAALGLLGAVAGGAMLSAVAAPLLEHAAGLGVDIDQLAQGVDVEGVAAGADGVVGGLGDQVTGIGDQLGGIGDQLGDVGLGDIFGR
ncbi:MAG: cation-transporting ATPase [Microbacterium sp.]|uniref:Cation-transporting ATPase n=2 Tax=Microbacterium ginsengisoli TaxID=400772 RepID=A0A3C1KF47_9MICO|nr:cation-transporting ATPase [uncultured Microbacterium sp.]MAL07306.1 cation-transporting ATPase [Microbacterium sp.]MBN9208355.1 cation-transporting ATPase [Microbacterium ginsengisoli]HAN25300.1 cation-transporting ATPase [Microbacterium ginsengisoli]